MPMAKNRGAAWGAMSRTSPIMVFFSILTAIKMTSFYFLGYYNLKYPK
jgi:lipoprotein signal peptidase